MKQMMRVAAMAIAGMMALSAAGADAYIESSGAQVIDTGYYPNPTTRIVIDFDYLTLKQQVRFFGTRMTDANYLTFEMYNSGSKDGGGGFSWAFCDGEGNWSATGYNTVTKSRVRFDMDGIRNTHRISTNGVANVLTMLSTVRPRTKTTKYSMALFGSKTGATAYSNLSTIKLYSCQIWDHGLLVHYYLPYKSGSTIGLKDVITGTILTSAKTAFSTSGGDITDDPQGDPAVFAGAAAAEAELAARTALLANRATGVLIAPGTGVATNVPSFGGNQPVQVNETNAPGGFVTMALDNFYAGDTWVVNGTLDATRLLAGETIGSLGRSGALVLDNGVLRYDGPAGATFSRAVTNSSLFGWAASVFDIGTDLTLTGAVGWDHGAFVKTGPGTLILDAAGTHDVSRYGDKFGLLQSQAPLRCDAGGVPTNGVSGFSLLEGRIVVKSGTWNFNSAADDAKIGGTTVDPRNPNGGQETSAVFQLDGGTVNFNRWLNLGGQNGFTTTTPNEVPSSGIIVNGGTFNARQSLTMGRNYMQERFTVSTAQRTCPFIEVHGGRLAVYATSRLGACDDPGADTRIFVDGGTLIVLNSTGATGSVMTFGNQNHGTAARHADVTVCTNGTLDVTDFYITGSRTNVTVNLKILNGGIFRTNALRKGGTGPGCEMNVLVDGGVFEIRAAGYTTWLRADLTSGRIGTHGAVFRSGSGCGANVIDTINYSFAAANTYPDEVAQGVTIRTMNASKNAGFRFVVPQHWDGPTMVENGAVCELAATGAFPAGTDLTVAGGGRLVVAAANQTVASLTLGVAGASAAATLNLLANKTITADAFAMTAGTTVAFNLFSSMTANGASVASGTALSAAGTYPLLVGPASEAANLSLIASRATWANAPAEGFTYSFDVTTEGNTATLVLTVADAAAGEPSEQVSPLDLVVPTDEGVTATVEAEDTAGKRSVTTNPTDAGGGTVVLGDSLAGFTGPLTAGSGLTTISDISFAATNPGWLTLGPGTLYYTGADATVAGLFINPGAGHGGVLRTDNDLTLLGASTGAGSIMKKGTGDLILKGTGPFNLGNVDNSYSSGTSSAQGVGALSDGIQANGDGPTTGLKYLMVSEGRVVVGTTGDDSDAPAVTTGNMTIGHRSAVTEGAIETAGELVMNNGSFYSSGQLIMSFYCGMLATTPEGGLHPKLTVNGGTFSVGSVNMNHDWQGNQTTSPTIEVNGGAFNCRGTFTIGNQLATSGVAQVSRVIVNGGTLTTKDLVVGNAAQTVESEIIINNGGTFVVSNDFTLGKASTAKPQSLYLNAGGTLKTLKLLAHTTGESYIYFRGGTWQPGLGRKRGASYTFGSSTAANRHTGVYLGEGGLTLDCVTHWEKVPGGLDASAIEMRQQILHDPDCAGADGGLTLKGHVTAIMRNVMNGSTFTGPVTASDGFRIGVENGLVFLDKTFVMKPSSGFRASGERMHINHLTLGEAGGTEPVVLDFCAGRANIGVVVSNELAVLSPVTVSFHRPGGASNTDGMQSGTYAVLIYPANLDDEDILGKFVPNLQFPEYTMTYTKEDETTGTWPGWKQITVTITEGAATAGTTWLDGTTGGTWSDGTKWDGGLAPNGTNALPVFSAATAAGVPVTLDADVTAGRVTLQGDSATSGYTLGGGAINLNHTDFRTPPAILAVSGTHAVNANVTTDDDYYRSYETDADGGYTGAIALLAESNATLVVNGTVTTDPKRPLYVNKAVEGGGTVKFSGSYAGGTGINLRSGTLEIDDLSPFAGQSLTIGTCTFHYSGPEAVTSLKVTAKPTGNYTSIMRLENDLTLTAPFDTTTGSLLKTGPGRLIFAPATGPTVTNRIGYQGINTDWNLTGAKWYWPDNGDCLKKQGAGGLSIDEGEIVLTGSDATYHLSNNGTARDVFIGANDRGWGYATNYAALTILSGTVRGPWVYLGHTFNRGKDASGHLIPTYSFYNQYGGNVTFSAFCFCYDLSDFDTAVQATANLYGGTLTNLGVMRFGQTYNKTGVNPPHATFNVYGGTYNHTDTSATKGTRMGYLSSKADGQKTLNRGTDTTLNMYGGNYNEIELIHMGCNATTSRLGLHGGVLKAENIIIDTSTSTSYCFFSGGKAYLYWNGGTFAPVGTAAADQTLTGLTEVLVSTNGAVVTTAELAGESYTVAQALLHDPDLEGADGGFVKQGAKPLALTGANTYTGDTVVEEGTLEIPAGANASALPADSAVVVAEGATLSMASGTVAGVGALRFDMGTQYGTLAGFAPAANGALYVTGVDAQNPKGLEMPVTVTDAQHPNKLTRWAVYVDGELDDRLSAFVRKKSNSVEDTIVLDGKQGLLIRIR